MSESSNVAFREGDKLKGLSNYYVWALKMRAVLRAEGQWAITEEEQSPTAFPVTIDGEALTEPQLKKKKMLAFRLLLLSVSDDLVDMIAEHSDPAKAWKTLKDQFHSGDQSQILTLMGQLQTLKMNEGGSVEDYLKRARELKNRLGSMGEKLSDRNVNQIVLNGLPRSYEGTIQTLTHLDATMSFDKLSASLLSEAHRREHRSQLLKDEEALAATYNKQATSQATSDRGFTPNRGRGGRWPQGTRGRGRGYYGYPRMPIICFNYNKPGHYARDCRAPRNPHPYSEGTTSKGTGFANSAEFFDSQLTHHKYDPYYY